MSDINHVSSFNRWIARSKNSCGQYPREFSLGLIPIYIALQRMQQEEKIPTLWQESIVVFLYMASGKCQDTGMHTLTKNIISYQDSLIPTMESLRDKDNVCLGLKKSTVSVTTLSFFIKLFSLRAELNYFLLYPDVKCNNTFQCLLKCLKVNITQIFTSCAL